MKKISLFDTPLSTGSHLKLKEVFESGQLAAGKVVVEFEEALENTLQLKKPVVTSDMTSAMTISLKLAGVKNDDEVILAPFTCLASSSAILNLGAKAVWAKMDQLWLDPKSCEKLITKKTKAIIIYHLAGYPGPIKEIRKLCDTYNIKMIEDCNNALLAQIDNILVGTLGDYSIYSFYPNRQVTTIEGGAIVCKSPTDTQRAVRLRKFGIDLDNFRSSNGQINIDFDVPEIGYSASMSNISAAIGLESIRGVKDRNIITFRNAEYIISELNSCETFQAISYEGSKPSFWGLLGYVTDNESFITYMALHNITCSTLHQRNDLYSCFNTEKYECSQVARLSRSLVAIPVGWWLKESDLDYIVDKVRRFVS